MITVYSGEPLFGLPNPSPFVCKTYIDLRRAGLDYEVNEASFFKAPKGKIPYISDGGTIIGDSHFIREHIAKAYGYDFNAGFDDRDLAIAWAVERMVEERLYFAAVYERWAIPANFWKGPARYFQAAPAPVRPIVRRLIRRKVLAMLKAQGISRHSYDEILQLMRGDLASLDALIADKTWLLGEKPCGADSSILAMLMSLYCSYFPGPMRDVALEFPRLAAYEERGRRLYFPEFS